MDVIWWQSSLKNFGDELNRDFWPRLFGDKFNKKIPNEAILGIGSIINFNSDGYRRVHVLGSGSKINDLRNLSFEKHEFWFVRGPLTASALNLKKTQFITDPAILVRDLYQISTGSPISGRVTFIPHLATDLNADWPLACERVGIQYCSPLSSLTHICKEIALSTLVITESLHGAIIADQYRVPWIPVGAAHTLQEPFKWHDWCQSMKLDYQPLSLPNLYLKELSLNEKIINRLKFNLASKSMGPNRWLSRNYESHGERELRAAAEILIKITKTGLRQLSDEPHMISLKQRMYERFMDFEKKILS